MQEKKLDLNTLMRILCDVYERKIPFNKVLGLSIESVSEDNTRVRFQMRQEMIGNYSKGILHGGVISSVLDTTGGLTASYGVVQKSVGYTLPEFEARISRIGTIDLRIDYLRPGTGAYFVSTSSIMRAGRRVTVTRMELVNDQNLLIAVGTGTYVVG